MKIDNRRCQDMMMFPTVVLMKHKKESRENWGNLCFVAYTQGVSFISVLLFQTQRASTSLSIPDGKGIFIPMFPINWNTRCGNRSAREWKMLLSSSHASSFLCLAYNTTYNKHSCRRLSFSLHYHLTVQSTSKVTAAAERKIGAATSVFFHICLSPLILH